MWTRARSSGIAITSTTGNGTWQYSTDGVTWTAFGAVSSSNALLLDSASQVRYIPDGLNGETATFGFVAWDQTTGTASTNATPRYANPGSGGGSTAYSSQSATGSMTITSVNDAPHGTSHTVTTPEDTAYVFTTADFGFSDPNDNPTNSFLAVEITTSPGGGHADGQRRRRHGRAVRLGQRYQCRAAGLHAGGQRQWHGLRQLHVPGAGRWRNRERRCGY